MTDTHRNTYLLTVFCSALATTLGASVLLGWYTHNTALIQVSAAFVPMQFNAALGFLLAGLGLLAATRASHLAVLVFGFLLTATGVLTLAEYILGVDLGIDQFLMQHYITVKTSHPGRMAPNTALCFALTGMALVLSCKATKSPKLLVSIATLGSLVFGLGFVALMGYTTSFEAAYGWGSLTRMAAHTAIGFLLLGLALLSLAWHWNPKSSSQLPVWFPLPVGASVATITVSLWQALNSQEARLTHQHGYAGGGVYIDDVLLVFGLVLAVVLSLSIYLAQTNRARGKEAAVAHRRLLAETNERKQAELELHEITERLQTSIEQMPIAYILWDKKFPDYP